MKDSLLLIVMLWLVVPFSSAQVGIEQYCFVDQNGSFTWVPLLHVESRNNWYAEGRYNYEAMNSVSLYSGRTFSHEGRVAYTATPLVGAVWGKFKGGSSGLNLNINYGKLVVSAQSQYTFSASEKSTNFIFNWSECAYQVIPWMYAGLSVQYTYYSQLKTQSFEPGLVMGITIGKLAFPIYCFRPAGQHRYFVFGITRTLARKKGMI